MYYFYTNDKALKYFLFFVCSGILTLQELLGAMLITMHNPVICSCIV